MAICSNIRKLASGVLGTKQIDKNTFLVELMNGIFENSQNLIRIYSDMVGRSKYERIILDTLYGYRDSLGRHIEKLEGSLEVNQHDEKLEGSLEVNQHEFLRIRFGKVSAEIDEYPISRKKLSDECVSYMFQLRDYSAICKKLLNEGKGVNVPDIIPWTEGLAEKHFVEWKEGKVVEETPKKSSSKVYL